ncbi:kinase [Sphingomonas sp. DBB INV C78]|uniref:kinase n=1 Tax=Sphingomonas sp. DBB INV C78 TaxID=3349434 RepID=UPI0036D347E7
MSNATAPATLEAAEDLVRDALAQTAGGLLVVGICGAQGSGKSTLAAALAERFEQGGTRTAILSLDDLYLGRAAREGLARQVHPLLRTRGVPGTHDVALGLNLIAALERGEAAPLPRFDKARDDRRPETEWDRAEPGTTLLILEGWCVGARPEPDAALVDSINALEQSEDADGRWRRFVNTALAGDYQQLFGRIDRLILLAAPSFDVVRVWRTQQEQELRARVGDGPGVMSDAEISRFIAHYERLTRHIIIEMPDRADLVVDLAADRSALRIKHR